MYLSPDDNLMTIQKAVDRKALQQTTTRFRARLSHIFWSLKAAPAGFGLQVRCFGLNFDGLI